MKKLSIIAIGLILILSGVIYAQQPNLKRGDRILKPRLAERVAKKLELTDEQIKQLKELNTNWRKERMELRKKERNTQKELRELMKEKAPNEITINQKLDEINALNLDLKKKGMKVELEKRKIYTDEQWDKVKRMRRFIAMRNRAPKGRHQMMAPMKRHYMQRDRYPYQRQFDRRYDLRKDRMHPGSPGMYYPGFGAADTEDDNFTSPYLFDEESFVLEDDLFFDIEIPFNDYVIE